MNRPYVTRDYRAVNLVFNAEYPMLRWLEANGYDVTYSTGVDSDRRGALIKNHKVFLSVGHDEYWSGAQRAHVEAARDAGVHLAFFSGNDVFWKIRWEPSIDPSHTPYRTMVTYKETHANAKIDPLPDVWTGTWRDSRPFNPEGPKPENALKGTIFTVNAWRNDPLIVPARFGRTALLAQHRGGAAEARSAGGARLRHPRPRMERGSGQRLQARRVDADVGNHRQQPAVHPGPRHRVRGRHGHASSDAVSRAERRAGLQRRHGAVGVGARPEPRYGDGDPAGARQREQHPRRRRPQGPGARDSAGDGESVRGHGRAAGDEAGGPRRARPRRPIARHPPRVSIPARRGLSRTAPWRSAAPRQTPAASSPASRSRSTAGEPGIQPRGPPDGATGSRRRLSREPGRSSAARSTTAGTWNADQGLGVGIRA